GLKRDEFVAGCSDLDDVIVFFGDGRYIITSVAEKKFVGKDILYLNVFKKSDSRTIYNVVYRDGKDGSSHIKRFAVTGIVRDREYNLTQGTPGSRVVYFTANPNGEAEVIKVTLRPNPRVRRIIFEADFSKIAIKGRNTVGNVLTKATIHKIALKQHGGSTLGGRKVWFDRDILRLNYDGRGEYLGEFQGDDQILVVLKSGDFYTTNFDLSNHYDADIHLIEKHDPGKVWTAVLYDADQGRMPYVKRFYFEAGQRKQNYLGTNRKNRLILLTDEPYPRLEVVFGGADKFREPLVVEVDEFTVVRSFKFRGKRLTSFKVDAVNELEPLRRAEPEPDLQQQEAPRQPERQPAQPGEMKLFADEEEGVDETD
ncbi:MAG: DNA gyrase/topoisomerase IV subunit A, partial [Prevotellaceae bacterium]|nr:DNA gyrase/topoisomerase IV subunit A [Prevotellaceae bacterium]